jgi:hypothetical protein
MGEPSRLARGARITGEIWKKDIKGSVAWDFLRREAFQTGAWSSVQVYERVGPCIA